MTETYAPPPIEPRLVRTLAPDRRRSQYELVAALVVRGTHKEEAVFLMQRPTKSFPTLGIHDYFDLCLFLEQV